MPGPDNKKTLHISGEIDLPTPGYTVTLTEGISDRAMPPSQRFRLALTKPGGMVAQVVTPAPVKYQGLASSPAYRTILILCGDRLLAAISDIPIAE